MPELLELTDVGGRDLIQPRVACAACRTVVPCHSPTGTVLGSIGHRCDGALWHRANWREHLSKRCDDRDSSDRDAADELVIAEQRWRNGR